MVSVDYWVELQGSRTSMPDTSRMIPAIESDRVGRPWVEFGGEGTIAYTSQSERLRFLFGMWVA